MNKRSTRRNLGRALRNLLLLAEILIVSLLLWGGGRFSDDVGRQGNAAVQNPGLAADRSKEDSDFSEVVQAAAPEFSWKNYRVAAHALGSLDGYSYLNARESFLSSYEKGIRLFEVDLTQTSDGVWVCRHSWNDSLGQWTEEGKKILTAEEFLTRPLYGKYTPMSLEDLMILLKDYPDAFVLLDSKQYSIRNYGRTADDYSEYIKIAQNADAEEVLGQLIPQIYNSAMFSGTALMYDFPSYLYSLWQEYSLEELQEIAVFCKEKKIPAVTVSSRYWSEEVQEIFEQQGIYVYVYTVNDSGEARKYIESGAAGVCSDSLLEKDLETKKGKENE